ncbi:hypothetical protein N499_1287B, partial [Wolbachia pipientis wVitA]
KVTTAIPRQEQP